MKARSPSGAHRRRHLSGAAAAILSAALVSGGCGRAANSPSPMPRGGPPGGPPGDAATAGPSPPALATAAPTQAVASTAPSPAVSSPQPLPAPLPPPPPPVPVSAVATVKVEPSWEACRRGFRAKYKDVARDVAALAQGCAAATKMRRLGPTFAGKQADQDKPQSFAFDARAQHCYRAYAQASEGIAHYDLVIEDSAGVIFGHASGEDLSAALPEEGAVCFRKDDRASVVVAVGAGSGAYAVEVWSD